MEKSVYKTLNLSFNTSHTHKRSLFLRKTQFGNIAAHGSVVSAYCYENQIPDFVRKEITQRYGSIFSSLEKLHLSGNSSNVSTFVAKKDGQILALLLFKRVGNSIQVLNQVITLTQEDINYFASYVFKTFTGIDAISLIAVHTDLQHLSFPFQRFNYSEDIVVTLPANPKEYLSSLGKSTRHNLNYYRNKLNRDFPPFTFTVYEKQAITAFHIRAVLDLSKQRIEGKGKSFGFSEQEQEHLFQLAQVDGLVGLIEIDGKVCAGSICYRAGDNYCLEVISHDPRFNEYRLGTLCCYLTIAECIDKGAKEFHFLWGEYDYKYRFLGQQRKLDNIAIYRSRWHMARKWKLVLRMQFNGAIRSAKNWKNNPDRGRTAARAMVHGALSFLRKPL